MTLPTVLIWIHYEKYQSNSTVRVLTNHITKDMFLNHAETNWIHNNEKYQIPGSTTHIPPNYGMS